MSAVLPNPQNWPQKRLRFVASVNKSRIPSSLVPEDEVSFVPMAAIGEYGGIDLSEIKTIEDVGGGYTPFNENDVIIAKITPCFENGKGAIAKGLMNQAAYGTTELHVVTTGAELLPEFAFFLSISVPFRRMGEASMYGAGGQKRVPESFVKDLRFGVPPIERQKEILGFLDKKLGEIDDLIEKKRRLLALLAEKRSALITRAVTKGLDPEATMKPSGIDWLGGIPENWSVKRLKYVAQYNLLSLPESTDPDIEIEYVDISSVSLESGIEKTQKLAFESAPSRARRIVQQGDVIVSTVRTYLRAIATIEAPSNNLIVSTGFAVLTPNTDLVPEFFGFYCVSDIFVSQVVAQSRGVSYPATNPTAIATIPIAVPPHNEQKEIADFLTNELDQIEKAVGPIRSAIDGLTEYRAAIITKAVTGELEIA